MTPRELRFLNVTNQFLATISYRSRVKWAMDIRKCIEALSDEDGVLSVTEAYTDQVRSVCMQTIIARKRSRDFLTAY